MVDCEPPSSPPFKRVCEAIYLKWLIHIYHSGGYDKAMIERSPRVLS